jgi:hypothetical protein
MEEDYLVIEVRQTGWDIELVVSDVVDEGNAECLRKRESAVQSNVANRSRKNCT